MKTLNEINDAITKLEIRMSKLEIEFEKDQWLKLHPPKYKYGDKGMVMLPKTTVKILESEMKHNILTPWDPYYWEYTVHLEGNGIAKYREEQIHL